MADPRTFTVKQCSPAYAAKSGAGIGNATSLRRDFFSAVGKVGDLAVLNSPRVGNVGKGLRNLASISNSIRTGSGSLPSSIGSSVDSGANWVLSNVGIAPATVQAVQGFNPGIANQAYSQAKNVFASVKAGNFKTSNIPSAMQDFQNLERLGRNIFTPGAGDVQTALGDRCEASPYAVDLIARSPKFKFLFVVQFVPNPGYDGLQTSDIGPLDMAFIVKKSSRPNIKFVEEPVNYYNFRSSVITKTEFEPMNMSFHDDNTNSTMRFYSAYLRTMSPITGIQESGAQSDMLEEGGMNFYEEASGSTTQSNSHVNQPSDIESTIEGSIYAASHGVLAQDNKQVFKEIRIYHLYDGGNEMNVFSFYNPQITTLNLDELDMSVSNEGNGLELTFNYDYVYVDTGVSVRDDTKYRLDQTQRGAFYPLRYNGGATSQGSNNSGILPYGIPTPAVPSSNPLNIINNASARVASAAKSAVAAVLG